MKPFANTIALRKLSLGEFTARSGETLALQFAGNDSQTTTDEVAVEEKNDQAVIEVTRRWVFEVVIGLNLCPFARRVSDSGLIRYAVTDAGDPEELLVALETELVALAAYPRSEVETTILIHPKALSDFSDYLAFLGYADRLVRRLGLLNTIQIAGFHPQYQFEGTTPESPENYTNRSPQPMLHLLREESVTEVAGDNAALAAIPERNIKTLRSLGKAEILARLQRING